MSEKKIRQYYNSILPTLNQIASDISEELNHYIKIKKLNNIDFVKCRVKDVDSFIKKSKKKIKNKLKYPNPIFEIQDIIGLRIIVYYLSDVDRIYAELKDKLYHSIEITHHTSTSDDDFKYEGKHFIIPIPMVFKKKYNIEQEKLPQVFELQILTLFQHAWATGEHDLTYKPKYDPTRDNKRYLAFVAAQSWGADRIFEEVNKQLNISKNDNV